MYKDILLPVDLEHESSWNKALPTAVQLCEQTGARLHLLMVVPDFGMSIVSQYFPKGYKKELSKKVLERIRKFSKKNVPSGITGQHVVGEGTVYEVILEIAEKTGSDLIVIAEPRPEHKHYLLGPNAARVVRHAGCSVLVVRD